MSVCIVLSLLTLIGIVKGLFVSLDVDESYSVAMAYRLVTGDKLVLDMWEPFCRSFYSFSGRDPSFLFIKKEDQS